MRIQPALDTNVGSSRLQLVRVDLHTPDGALLATLPVTGGQVTDRAGDGWTGTVDLAGEEWVPAAPTDPLAGFGGHWVRIWAGQVVDQEPAWLALAELLVAGARVTRTPDGATTTIDLIDVLGWAARAEDQTYRVDIGQNVNAAIRQVLKNARPPSWPTLGFVGAAGTGVPVPAGFHNATGNPLDLVDDLAAIGNVNVRARWDRTVVIENPRGQTPGPVVRALTVESDIETIDVQTGRDAGSFANHVELEFAPVGDVRGRTTVQDQWTYRTGWSWPANGQARHDPGTGRWRLAYRALDGDQRRRALQRIERGALVLITAANGWELVATVDDIDDNPDDKAVELELATVDTEGTFPADQARLTVRFYALPADPVVGTATQTTGPLAVSAVGRVTYRERHAATVTQAQATARAAQILPRVLAGWATTVVDIVPDHRLQTGDTVTVRYLTGDTVAHRVTTITYPLGVDTPMRVGLRTHDTTMRGAPQ